MSHSIKVAWGKDNSLARRVCNEDKFSLGIRFKQSFGIDHPGIGNVLEV